MTYIWERKDWPNFKWQNDKLIDLLGKARLAQGKLLSKVGTLGMDMSEESRSEILVEETIKTAAIEGQKLDEEAVRSSVARRLGLPTGGVKKEDRNAEGMIDVIINATVDYKKPLTIKRLKSWQAALFPTEYSGLSKIHVGKWRGKEPMQVISGPIGREKIHFEALPYEKLNKEMKHFIDWWENKSKKTDGLIRAGVAHFYFVSIHPFEDGNGRIARALTDMALAQDESLSKRYYSLSSRIMKERESYYNILEKTQKGTLDITEWLEWFLLCYLRALEDSETAISKVLKKAEFWRVHAQTELNKNQRKVINKLLEVGPEGFEGGLTTRKYVSMTKTSRATAYRDIVDMVNKDILVRNKGKGRSVSYRLK
ncbi:MAG: Fic family protein [Candidatus Omnitrophica bacterium]|nr:Fic family protein [Candidatus Omnitrophota bacterium]